MSQQQEKSGSLNEQPVRTRPRVRWTLSQRWLAATAALWSLLVLTALASPVLAPFDTFDPGSIRLADAQLPPYSQVAGRSYLAGTDGLGRDLFSAILYGARTTLVVAGVSTVLAIVIGTMAGVVAAYRGGLFESILMRIVDFQLSVPTILLALLLLAVFGQGLDKVVLAIVAAQWPYYARTARSAALVERQLDYMVAAKALGYSHRRRVFQHLLPNSLAPVLILAVVLFSEAMLIESTLSFLGLGAPVNRPSLGMLVANGFEFIIAGLYWITLIPGACLVGIVFATNLLAEAIRRVADPAEN
jgi:peptide/nickel transport system permease protein